MENNLMGVNIMGNGFPSNMPSLFLGSPMLTPVMSPVSGSYNMGSNMAPLNLDSSPYLSDNASPYGPGNDSPPLQNMNMSGNMTGNMSGNMSTNNSPPFYEQGMPMNN